MGSEEEEEMKMSREERAKNLQDLLHLRPLREKTPSVKEQRVLGKGEVTDIKERGGALMAGGRA